MNTVKPVSPDTKWFTSTASTNVNINLVPKAVTLTGLVFSNTGASACYLKLYDKAGTLNPATDSAFLKLTIMLPAGGAAVAPDLGPCGLSFMYGVAFAVTALAADTDVTAITANAVRGALSTV